MLLLASGRRAEERRADLASELAALGARVVGEAGCLSAPAYALLLVDADSAGVSRAIEAIARVRARWLVREAGVAVNGVDGGSEGIAAFRGLATLGRSRDLDVQLDYLGHVRGFRRARGVAPAAGFKVGDRGPDFLLDLEAGMPSDACIRFIARRAVAACPREAQPAREGTAPGKKATGLREFWRALMGEGDA